jgi:putative Holliday junction resolvase
MAIDYGDARTGAAISDSLGMLTGKTAVIRSWNAEKTAEQLALLAQQNHVDRLVLGLPRNMDGTEGPRAALCREFAETLKRATGLEPVMWDERRTTIEAHQILSENDCHGKKRKNTVDAVAASLILEGYLAWLRNQKEREHV